MLPVPFLKIKHNCTNSKAPNSEDRFVHKGRAEPGRHRLSWKHPSLGQAGLPSLGLPIKAKRQLRFLGPAHPASVSRAPEGTAPGAVSGLAAAGPQVAGLPAQSHCLGGSRGPLSGTTRSFCDGPRLGPGNRDARPGSGQVTCQELSGVCLLGQRWWIPQLTPPAHGCPGPICLVCRGPSAQDGPGIEEHHKEL